ncbi:TraB/GumN family protein [Pseudogemmobacter bohemicus]|uniref:TraB/GumN family protein n=1 Tax=Pseudogemmobacter bohemicus TaxID=2250708 RepID=UPI000DD4BD9D|nr:TraB/GumN family protein [Pseudogemmobacter bohemicus]
MKHLAAAAFALFGLVSQAAGFCGGTNLVDQMLPGDLAEIRARAHAVPYARGNFWTAAKDGQTMTIVGTYHIDDPRHMPVLPPLTERIGAASVLLVEAGPEEEDALMKAMGKDPSLMFITDGPSLLERLPRDTWRRLSEALEARGIPGVFAAKFQPWYATVVLAIPPCMITQPDLKNGLDAQLIDAAEAAGVRVQALEPYDTLFSIFGALTEDQSIAMIEASLALEGQSEDLAVTTADLYFEADSRMIWELNRLFAYDQPGYTKDQVDAEMAVMEDVMMIRRNQAWIPVIEAAAAEGPLVVAFGALHLSGEEGVLNLLARNGWTLTELDLAGAAAQP